MKRKLLRLAAIALAVVLLCAGAWGARRLYAELRRKNALESRVASNQERLLEAIAAQAPRADFSYEWVEAGNACIAHALGGIDGRAHVNCLEGFEASLAKGFRVFEVDLLLTEDLRLVCAHDEAAWRKAAGLPEDTSLTYANFAGSRPYGAYTPLTAEDVLGLMAEHPDIYVITDTKYSDRDAVTLQFSLLVKLAKDRDPALLERIIPQIYDEDMYAYVMYVHPFRSMIYTVYNTETLPDLVVKTCEALGIGFVTMPQRLATREVLGQFRAAGIHTGVHTVNDADAAAALLAEGADMLYTDTLLPGARSGEG